jgi:hypothetical protein
MLRPLVLGYAAAGAWPRGRLTAQRAAGQSTPLLVSASS